MYSYGIYEIIQRHIFFFISHYVRRLSWGENASVRWTRTILFNSIVNRRFISYGNEKSVKTIRPFSNVSNEFSNNSKAIEDYTAGFGDSRSLYFHAVPAHYPSDDIVHYPYDNAVIICAKTRIIKLINTYI